MNKIYALLASIFLLLFCALTIAAKFDLTTSFDFDTTVRIQDHMPQKLKPYLIKIVELGSWQIMSVITFVTMIIHRKNFWKIGILFILIATIEIYGKYEMQHPPPPQFMLLRFEHLDLPKYYVRDTASYPSGHAARPAYLMMVWIPFLYQSLVGYIKRHNPRKINTDKSNFTINLPFGFTLSRTNGLPFEIIDLFRLLLFLLAFSALTSFTFIVGFTKIYLGEHWTSDVIGGWLLGSGFGLLTHISIIHTLKKQKISEQNT